MARARPALASLKSAAGCPGMTARERAARIDLSAAVSRAGRMRCRVGLCGIVSSRDPGVESRGHGARLLKK